MHKTTHLRGQFCPHTHNSSQLVSTIHSLLSPHSYMAYLCFAFHKRLVYPGLSSQFKNLHFSMSSIFLESNLSYMALEVFDVLLLCSLGLSLVILSSWAEGCLACRLLWMLFLPQKYQPFHFICELLIVFHDSKT